MRVIRFVLGFRFPDGFHRMDAYLSNLNNLSYSDEHPVIIAATSEVAMARAERAVHASGYRIGARVSVEDGAGSDTSSGVSDSGDGFGLRR